MTLIQPIYLLDLFLTSCFIDLLNENLLDILIFTFQYYLRQLLFIIIELKFSMDISQQ
jgi:hypothetical protein